MKIDDTILDAKELAVHEEYMREALTLAGEAAERDEELDEANREQWAKLAALKAEMENNN